MRNYSLLFLIITAVMYAGCSEKDDHKSAIVNGKITVADSVDASQNYAGINLVILKQDSSTVPADTLFHAKTDKDGTFSGTARFIDRRQYLLVISRNDRNLGRAGVILAANDTLNITAELPGVRQTLDIQSHEHRALQTYNRVDRSFQRVGVFARAGRLKGDSLTAELKKWPDIYWEVYEKYPKTIAGSLAAKKTVELLSQWNQPGMMEKLEELKNNDDLVYLAATYGTQYKAKREELSAALAYLDDLASKTKGEQARMRIQMERINLLYDSARVQAAQRELDLFKEEFSNDKVARDWAASVEYDLNFLSPGDAIPNFSFTVNGNMVSREKLKGKPYLLEITSLQNPIYQQQFDRTVVIHSLYKNYNFEIVTIPLDTSRVTVKAFFDERVRPWPVAPANTFSTRELIERFNINNLPTRFLVDQDGRIVRRYVGDEYQEVIQGIQQIMNNNN